MTQPTSNKSDQNQTSDDHSNTSVLSTDSLISLDTTASTINPLQRGTLPPKDYASALSILQSRYGASGQIYPSPKSKPSSKLQNVVQASGEQLPQGGSQLTLVSTPSIPTSTATAGSSGSSTPSSSTAQSTHKKGKISGLRSLFKGKGKDKAT